MSTSAYFEAKHYALNETDEQAIARYKDTESRADLFSTLLQKHRKLIIWLCNKHYAFDLELDDKLSIAQMEFYNCISSYQPDRGMKFTTYATMRMVGKLTKLHEEMHPEKHTGEDAPAIVSLEAQAEKYLEEYTIAEQDTQELASQAESTRIIKAKLAYLSERELFIFTHLHGLFGAEEMTLQDIAELLGISLQGVDWVNKKIMKELETKLKAGFRKEDILS